MALEKPVVGPPDGPPPADLVVEDLTVGVSHSTGREFDASWNRGEPFSFPIGGGQVIAGWDQGVAGMKVGGRRRLTIPPHLGYGDRGAGGVIKPGETLVFVVDLVGVQ
jgi:peptidylprolyl isomerase